MLEDIVRKHFSEVRGLSRKPVASRGHSATGGTRPGTKVRAWVATPGSTYQVLGGVAFAALFGLFFSGSLDAGEALSGLAVIGVLFHAIPKKLRNKRASPGEQSAGGWDRENGQENNVL